MVDSLLLKVGLLNQQLTGSIEYLLSGVIAQSLNGIDNPLVYLIGKLIQVDILISLTLIHHTEYVDGMLGEHRGQLDVHTALTNCERHLLRLQIDLGFVVSLIQRDTGHLSG